MMRRFIEAATIVLILQAIGFVCGIGFTHIFPPRPVTMQAAELTQCGSPRWVIMPVGGRPMILSWNELRDQSALAKRYGAADIERRAIACAGAR